MIKTIGGIYAIVNTKTGKRYIGSSVDIKKRWHSHRRELKKGTHANKRLQRSWIKHGKDAFRFEVIEQINYADALLCREQYWIDNLKVTDRSIGYNICPVAGKTQLGVKRSKETKALMSVIAKKRIRSPETIEKHAQRLRGRRVSDVTHAKMILASLVRKGIKRSPEICAKIAAGGKGKIISLETREKLRLANLGKKMPEETKAKISAALTGIKRTVETKAKMSVAKRKTA